MSDKLIHDYFGVDIDTVWETVEKDIPLVKRQNKGAYVRVRKISKSP
jgi:uncharacterized protein with HEPN domain